VRQQAVDDRMFHEVAHDCFSVAFVPASAIESERAGPAKYLDSGETR